MAKGKIDLWNEFVDSGPFRYSQVADKLTELTGADIKVFFAEEHLHPDYHDVEACFQRQK